VEADGSPGGAPLEELGARDAGGAQVLAEASRAGFGDGTAKLVGEDGIIVGEPGSSQKISDTETLSASVTSSVVIDPSAWYRVRCTRQDTTLKIVVTRFNADGTPQPAVTNTKTAIPAIDLTWPTTLPIVPMSIGGKLNPNSTISGQSDQFNGLIDNATLTVG